MRNGDNTLGLARLLIYHAATDPSEQSSNDCHERPIWTRTLWPDVGPVSEWTMRPDALASIPSQEEHGRAHLKYLQVGPGCYFVFVFFLIPNRFLLCFFVFFDRLFGGGTVT
jgi:hypothetical protein